MKKDKQKRCPNCGGLARRYRKKLHRLGYCLDCLPPDLRCSATLVNGKPCRNPQLGNTQKNGPFCTIHRYGARGDKTTFGYVYLMSLGFEGMYKIGASKDPHSRLLSLQASNPKMKLIKMWHVKGYERVESRCHTLLKDCRVEREIFYLNKTTARELYDFMKKVSE